MLVGIDESGLDVRVGFTRASFVEGIVTDGTNATITTDGVVTEMTARIVLAFVIVDTLARLVADGVTRVALTPVPNALLHTLAKRSTGISAAILNVTHGLLQRNMLHYNRAEKIIITA